MIHLERFSISDAGNMARRHLIVVLWLGVAAAESKSAASERRLSATDFRTFRGKLDPPAAGRGRHHLFIHIPKAAGASFMKASVDWMSRKDTLTGSHEKNAFSPVTLGQLKKDTIPPRPPPPGSDVRKVRAGDRYEGPVPREKGQDVGRGVERRVRRSQRRGRGL